MVAVNTILYNQEEEKEYRILWLSEAQGLAYIFALTCDGMPAAVTLREIGQRLLEGTLTEQAADPYFKAVPENEIPDSYKNIRDSIWRDVEGLVSREPAIYDRHQRGEMIAELKAQGHEAASIYRHLKRYWQRGKSKNAFLPDYMNCGGRGKEKTFSGKRNGRRPQYSNTISRSIDGDTKKIFEQAVQKYYHTRKEYSFKAAYELMVKEYYTRPAVQPDGTTRLELLDIGEIPSLRQFRYWYSKHYSEKEKIVSRKGQSKFDLDHRAVPGRSDTDVYGPGAQFQIDATVGDIYLISRFNRASIIGRPVIYFVVDVFSRMVTGMYVGLEGPSWAGAMMALANSASDKVGFCKAYGIDISEKEWPCHHIPDTIRADRGEMESRSVETLINSLNIRVDNTPAYRADMKGIVEQLFHTINTTTTVFLPGHVRPDMTERGGRDYRLDAKLDIMQFTKIMIQCVLNHNNSHVLKGYERTEGMVADGVVPIPRNLWEWGISHCSGILRTVPEDTVKLCLMPADRAMVTPRGIKFRGLHYLNERILAEHWLETARAKGSFRVDISYDPRDMGQIYVRRGEGGFEQCALIGREKKWSGKSLDELVFQQADERGMQGSNEAQELQARVDLNAEIEKIVSEAEQQARQTETPSSKAGRTSQIRQNREREKQELRKDEAFVLGGQPQGEDTHPAPEPLDGEVSPTLAMIKQKLEERLKNGK